MYIYLQKVVRFLSHDAQAVRLLPKHDAAEVAVAFALAPWPYHHQCVCALPELVPVRHHAVLPTPLQLPRWHASLKVKLHLVCLDAVAMIR